MGRVRRFILAHFSRSFLLIFLPLFFIVSLTYIIRLSKLSAMVSLDGVEFFGLFALFLPDILFYTLPISYIVAVAVTLTKLSEGNELIALFSFGKSPASLLSVFLLPTLLLTALMLIVSLLTIPNNTVQYQLLKGQKMAESKLIIEPNQLGQKFGNYIVFVGSKEGERYRNIVLFSKQDEKKMIFIAREGSIENNQSRFSLNLYHGSGDTFLTDSVESVTFDRMSLYKYPENSASDETLHQGWSHINSNPKAMARFLYNIFFSFSPMLILGIVAAFSIVNPRYQKSRLYLISFSSILLVYGLASLLKKQGTPTLFIIIVALLLWAAVSLFERRVERCF